MKGFGTFALYVIALIFVFISLFIIRSWLNDQIAREAKVDGVFEHAKAIIEDGSPPSSTEALKALRDGLSENDLTLLLQNRSLQFLPATPGHPHPSVLAVQRNTNSPPSLFLD